MKAVHKPTRNPFRIALAAWRVIRDLSNTEDALIVEMAFFKSRLFRRFARWEESARELCADPRTAPAFEARPRLGTLDLDGMSALPVGTIGAVFAAYIRANGLNPYLFDPIHDACDGDYVMAHLLETHDIWHVVTGFDTSEAGEFALTAFYAAQTGLTSAAMLLTFGFANTTLFAPNELRARMDAIATGWIAGKRAEPLFGTDWNAIWSVPLEDLRERFGLNFGARLLESERTAA